MDLILKYFTSLTPQQINQFNMLQALYAEWNERINVVSRKDIDALYLHHVLHSLAISRVVRFNAQARILDVGTGGGFPAVPLAIMFPESQFLAVDTIGKKIKVVNAVVESLGLSNIRAEQVQASEAKGSFDFVVSRAVTQLGTLLPWVWDKIGRGNTHALPNGILSLKGGELQSEISEAVQKMNLNPSQIIEYPISAFFNEDYFDTKKVLYVQR